MDGSTQNKKSEVKVIIAAIGCFNSVGHKRAANDNVGQFCLALKPANNNCMGNDEPED